MLSTNLQRNLDDAFLRRMQEVVDFPLPSEELREKIWRQHVPTIAPTEPASTMDFWRGSSKLSGGNIKNAVMTAAFLAAAAGKKIGMQEMVRGVRTELQKQGKLGDEDRLRKILRVSAARGRRRIPANRLKVSCEPRRPGMSLVGFGARRLAVSRYA